MPRFGVLELGNTYCKINDLYRKECVRKADFEEDFEQEYGSALFQNYDDGWGPEVLQYILEIETPLVTS